MRTAARREEGFTLIELTIAMSVFMVVLVLFAAAIGQFTSATTRTVQLADQGNEARTVYNLFDRSVRIAAAVNRPQKVGNNWYVEWLTSVTTPNLCTQWVLRTDTHTLALRTWVPVSTGTTTPTDWRTVSLDAVNTTAQAPFVFTPATMTSPVQRLGISLYYRRSSAIAATLSTSDFVALNSGISTVTNPDVNSDGVSDKEVCTDISNRRP
jgi:type II secretory pathway pseudopilin PulG